MSQQPTPDNIRTDEVEVTTQSTGATGRPPSTAPTSGRQSSDEIRREIEETRSDLGETISTLEDRVSPSRIRQRQTSRVRGRWESIRGRVMGSDDSSSSSSGGSSERAQQAKETLSDAPDRAREQMQGNPLAAGLIAFGGGMLLAALAPSTQREQQAAQQLRDQVEEPLRGELQSAGQQLQEGIKQEAQQRAMEVGKEAMSAASRTGNEASDRAKSVQGDAKKSADQVRNS